MRSVPPHLRQVTDMVCEVSDIRQPLVSASQIRTSPSFDALHNFRHTPSKLLRPISSKIELHNYCMNTIFGQMQRLPRQRRDPLLVSRQRPPALLPRLGVPHDHRAGLENIPML